MSARLSKLCSKSCEEGSKKQPVLKCAATLACRERWGHPPVMLVLLIVWGVAHHAARRRRKGVRRQAWALGNAVAASQPQAVAVGQPAARAAGQSVAVATGQPQAAGADQPAAAHQAGLALDLERVGGHGETQHKQGGACKAEPAAGCSGRAACEMSTGTRRPPKQQAEILPLPCCRGTPRCTVHLQYHPRLPFESTRFELRSCSANQRGLCASCQWPCCRLGLAARTMLLSISASLGWMRLRRLLRVRLSHKAMLTRAIWTQQGAAAVGPRPSTGGGRCNATAGVAFHIHAILQGHVKESDAGNLLQARTWTGRS
jgi:hypothetical protein